MVLILMPSYFNKGSELKTSESYFDYYDLAKPNNKYRPIYSEEKLCLCSRDSSDEK